MVLDVLEPAVADSGNDGFTLVAIVAHDDLEIVDGLK